jgi:hypothetical protein
VRSCALPQPACDTGGDVAANWTDERGAVPRDDIHCTFWGAMQKLLQFVFSFDDVNVPRRVPELLDVIGNLQQAAGLSLRGELRGTSGQKRCESSKRRQALR